jgi:hypothetical protein
MSDVPARWLLLTLALIACTGGGGTPADTDLPSDTDGSPTNAPETDTLSTDPPDTDPPDTDVPDTDPPDTDPPDTDSDAGPVALTAAVSPANPGWRDDLSCAVGGLQAGEAVTVTWQVNGNPYSTTASDVWPGDRVPHLEQAGGQRWTCTASSSLGRFATSDLVTVAGPLELIELPPGTTALDKVDTWPPGVVYTFSFPVLLGATETTQGLWTQMGMPLHGRVSTPPYNDPTHAVAWISAQEAVRFLNALSVHDGVTPCYACSVDGCALESSQPAICDGYRLPTPYEWRYAYTSLGQFQGDFPDGSSLDPDWARTPHNRGDPLVDATGHPTGRVVQDFCANPFGPAPAPAVSSQGGGPARTTLPNSLGFYDMCGNVSELVDGLSGIPSPSLDPHFPYRFPYMISSAGCPTCWPTSPGRYYAREEDRGLVGVRIARTNHPLSLPTP